MKNDAPCPCQNCPCALTCWWTCDELSAWAENKTFAQVADAFIAAYNHAENAQKRLIESRQIPSAERGARRSPETSKRICPPAGM